MTRPVFLSVALVLLTFVVLASPQAVRPHMPTPPPPLDSSATNQAHDPASAHPSARIDLEQVQQEADDLARTAQAIQLDVASVRKGMLPKDMIDRLKHVEKLSKHLRGQLVP